MLCDPQGVEVLTLIYPQVIAAVAARPVAMKRGSLSGSISRCEVVASGSTTRRAKSVRTGTRWEGSAVSGTRREGSDTGVEAGTPCGCSLLSHRSRGVAPMTRGSGNASIPATPLGCRTDRLTDMCDTLAGSLKALLGDPQGVEGVGKGLCTSVTASRMTDAYGAGTPVGVHRSPLFTMSGVAPVTLKCVTPGLLALRSIGSAICTTFVYNVSGEDSL